MSKLAEIGFKTILLYCIIAFARDFPGINLDSDNIYMSTAKMLWIYFRIPISLVFLYWISSLKLPQRLDNTNQHTSLDLWIISGCVAGIFILIQSRLYFQLPLFNIFIEYLWILAIVALLYTAWLWRRSNHAEILNNDGVVLQSDEPSKTDELGRDFFAEEVTAIVENSQFDATFVLAITGQWGEGKSTLMKFVLEKIESKKKVTAYCFDPWYFNSQEALITNFFNSLYAKLNEKKFVLSSPVIFNMYSRIIGGKELGIAGKIIDALGNYAGQLKKIKCEIERCLNQNNKRVVIFIDNLDRLDRDELLLTFKLVRLCTDFPKVMFVLLYDKYQIFEILNADQKDNDFGKKYMEKIVQGEIALPIADPISIRMYWERLLGEAVGSEISKLKSDEQLIWTEAIERVSRKITNIRIAKLHINWLTLKIPHFKKNDLNFIDFFIVESIALFFPKAYQDIYRDSLYLPYYARINLHWGGFDKKKIAESRKACYEKIVSAYLGLDGEVLRELLSMLFVSYRNYVNGSDDLYGGEEGSKKYFESRPIDDERYFNSYFSYTPTPRLIIANTLCGVLQEIVSGSHKPEENIRNFSNLVVNLNMQGSLSELLIHLRQNTNVFEAEVYEPIVKALALNSRLFKDESKNMRISDLSRVQYIVVDLIKSCPDKKIAQTLLEEVVSSCEDYSFIRAVLYHFKEEELKDGMNIIAVRKSFAQRIDNLIEQEYNFFIPAEYCQDFWAVLDYAEEAKISKYLQRILKKDLKSLQGFLNLLVQTSISLSGGIHYMILKDYYRMFGKYISYELIDKLVDEYMKEYTEESLPQCFGLYKDYRRAQEAVETKNNLPDEAT